jgi:hypothetical protein
MRKTMKNVGKMWEKDGKSGCAERFCRASNCSDFFSQSQCLAVEGPQPREPDGPPPGWDKARMGQKMINLDQLRST